MEGSSTIVGAAATVQGTTATVVRNSTHTVPAAMVASSTSTARVATHSMAAQHTPGSAEYRSPTTAEAQAAE
jgi:hypothetical protein